MNISNLKAMRRVAGVIAKSVRNHIEDMHAEGKTLTDDNMKEFNTNVRKWIYEALLLIAEQAESDNPFISASLNFLQPNDYREEDCYDEVENNLKFFIKTKVVKKKSK